MSLLQYTSEPPTSGRVKLEFSTGPAVVELWSRECPKACRNFVQLCLEGFYDGCIVHRIVKDYLLQTGDPTGTGDGGESAYGVPFRTEPHSRLQFTRRGLLGMAGSKEDNGSQFFITLGPCSWLNKQHTVFGRVEGNGIFNVIPMGDLETEEGSQRPLFPPKLLKATVLDNPFDDIVPREPSRPPPAEEGKPKRHSCGPTSSCCHSRAARGAPEPVGISLLSHKEDIRDELELAPDADMERILSSREVLRLEGAQRREKEQQKRKADPQLTAVERLRLKYSHNQPSKAEKEQRTRQLMSMLSNYPMKNEQMQEKQRTALGKAQMESGHKEGKDASSTLNRTASKKLPVVDPVERLEALLDAEDEEEEWGDWLQHRVKSGGKGSGGDQ